MRQWKTSVLAVAMLVLVGASVSGAQIRSSAQGFVLGVGANGSAIRADEEAGVEPVTETGAGISFLLGFNFTSRFGLVLNASGANMKSDDGDYSLGQADLAVRLMLAGAGSSLVPYLDLGYAGLVARDDSGTEDVELSGTGFTGALGLHYFFSPGFALDLNARYTKGEFTTLKVGGESVTDDDGVKVTAARLNLGLAFFP